MGQASRRRWQLGILAALVAVCGSVIAVGALLRPPPLDGYGPALEKAVVGACVRSGPGVADPASTCRCAYRYLEANVAFERFARFDDDLRHGGRPVPELTAAVAECSAAPQ